MQRPNVLIIAGHDPSGAAGLLADVKAVEQQEAYALGVATAITYQNDAAFEGLDWLTVDQVKKQIEVLHKSMPFETIKIGIVPSLQFLNSILAFIKGMAPDVTIVWDPVIAATAGFTFLSNIDAGILDEVLDNVDVVTPNIPEVLALSDAMDISEEAFIAYVESKQTAILVKGGHSDGNEVNDVLYHGGTQTVLTGRRFEGMGKRGTGCVLSSSIAVNMAKEKTVEEACKAAKEYIHTFLQSTDSIIGYHKV